MADLQVGVIGAAITVTLRDQDGALIDLSTSTTRYLYLTRPNNRGTKKFTATLVGGGTGGQMSYVTVAATDIDSGRPDDPSLYTTPSVATPSGARTLSSAQ
jgi:hypothetical protein